MTDSNLIELAKLGDPQAIAALMNQSLESRGMRATVDRQGDCLEVMLEAERIPNRQSLTAFVQKGIDNLGIQSIASIRILGQQFGASYPAWMQELHLDASPDAEIGTAPLPIQSETAIDSSTIPDQPSTLLETDDFSLTDPINADSLLESEQFSSTSAELNELWSPTPEPDFLQELLATETATANGLPGEPATDEAAIASDDGLIDFLGDLSGEPASEEFPSEAIQEQTSFMAGIDNPESGSFQDLFAESSDLSNSLLDDANGLAWEDSAEPIAAGEPDADLLDFLNTPDDRLTSPEELPLSEMQAVDQAADPLEDRFNVSGLDLEEQILTEYPDAVSIDQLPEDLFAELEEPETPLQEPSEDFLSTLLGEPIEPLAPEALPDLPPDQPDAATETLFSYERSDSEPVSEPLADPLLQDPWVANPLTDSETPFDRPEFPADVSADLAPFSAEPAVEESEMEEALPDFLVEPMLDWPETDPAEMTLVELEEQPEVLDAAVEESIDEPIQFPQNELDATASSLNGDWAGDEASFDLSLDQALSSDSVPEPDWVEEPVAMQFESGAAASEIPVGSSPDAAPDAALLSNFADSQTDTTFWAEDSEDDVEELPPDFLQEIENWSALDTDGADAIATPDMPTVADLPAFPTAAEPLAPSSADQIPEFEQPSDPDPEWSALEAQLSALDLSSDEIGVSVEETDLAASDQDFSIDQLGLELGEPLVETPEGTAIEPPADWVAAAAPTNLWPELMAEVHPLPDSDQGLSEPVESSEVESSGTDVTTPNLEASAPLPELSQDELEAGLGDFRAGFVEPLPPEFFEEDEPQTDYPDWQSDLREPLALDDEDDETGYIIEDSTPAVEYSPPPLPPDPEVRQSGAASRSSDIFVMVLFAICAVLGMLGGYVLFKSRLSPNPSNVPPPTEPPATGTPVPAPSTSANPTSSSEG